MELRKDNRPILSFAKLKSVMPMPNLLDVQLRSFEKLVEQDPEEQWDFGLDRVFGEIFPIEDVNENFMLEYVSASLGEPKYSVEECIERDMTYAAPLKATPTPHKSALPERTFRGIYERQIGSFLHHLGAHAASDTLTVAVAAAGLPCARQTFVAHGKVQDTSRTKRCAHRSNAHVPVKDEQALPDAR